MAERRIRKPIHLLGFARSGTTMLGYAFQAHPDVCIFNEPRTIWGMGNSHLQDDVLGAEHLTPEIADRIDRAFAEGMARKGGSRFVEKTPSNCLRVPFLHALYPDGKIVHIIRDGRGVVRSLLKEEARTPSARRIRKRLAETPLREWLAFLPMVLRTVWRTRVLGKQASFWGPRPPGWQAWVDEPGHVRAGRQWAACVKQARIDGRALPRGCYLEVRYEEFVEAPAQWVKRIYEFCELPLTDEVLAWVDAEVNGAPSAGKPSPLSDEEEAAALEPMREMLVELGYLGPA